MESLGDLVNKHLRPCKACVHVWEKRKAGREPIRCLNCLTPEYGDLFEGYPIPLEEMQDEN